MVEAEQMEDGRVQVVHMDAILHGMHAQFVGRPVRQATFHTATRQENREPRVVMVPAVFGFLL